MDRNAGVLQVMFAASDGPELSRHAFRNAENSGLREAELASECTAPDWFLKSIIIRVLFVARIS